MTGFTAADLADAADRAKAAMASLEQVLNQADSRLGDGDTGSMLRRLLDGIAAAGIGAAPDVGAAFRQAARAATSSTGSSLGTLVATALLTIGRATAGRTEVPWPDLGGLLGEAATAMFARGGAARGDKTVLDALDAVSAATGGLADAAAIAEAARREGRATLDRFRPLPCKIGRARMFAEKSTGTDDPGMLALVLLTEAVSGQAPARD